MPTENLTLDTLHRLLAYDPATGIFTWKHDRRPRTKAGDEAGSIKGNWNYYVLTINGQAYQGHRLAWFYVYGVWPEGVPVFRDGDTANCAIDNLKFVRPTYSDDPRAVLARKYRAKKKTARYARPQESPIADITKSQKGWKVHIPGTPHNAFAYDEKNLDTAIRKYLAHCEGLKVLERLPPRQIVESDFHTFAGDPSSIDLAEAIGWLCYDPDTGHFYHRTRHTRATSPRHQPRAGTYDLIAGMRADELNTAGTPVLKLFGRDYPASMMAMFMQNGQWPKRRSVRHHDNDRKNTAWSNLYLKDETE